MKIEIIERNYDVGNRLGDLINKKLEKFARYFDDNASAKVVCAQEGKKFKLELTVVNKNNVYRSEAYGENMFDNLDVVLPKVEKQILKYASKNKNKFKESALELEEVVNAEKAMPKNVIKTKHFELEPILLEDAKEALENVGHEFYVFLNAETGKVNVVYKRGDGELGLIALEY